jgi:hypothetical protein
MQQFFAGGAGVQNGAVQLAIDPQAAINNPGVQAFTAGMYRPVFYVNDAVNGYPKPLGRGTAGHDLSADATVVHFVTNDGVDGVYTPPDAQVPQLTMHARLSGSAVEFDYQLATGDASRVAIRLFPGYGVLWRDLRQSSDGLDFVSDPFALTGVSTASERGVGVRVRALADSQVKYLERDPQFGLQSIEISPSSDGRVQFRVSLATSVSAGRVTRFDQRELARRLHITDVVLWKDTGWKTRFSEDSCFAQLEETNRLLIYRLKRRCPSGDVARGSS